MTAPHVSRLKRVAAAARAHAARAYPHESCGLVVGRRYVAQANLCADPAAGFRLDPGAVLEAHRAGLDAIVHSHPHPHPPCPTAADMRLQIDHDVPCAIVPVSAAGEPGQPVWWGPGVAIAPLIGRPYVHGITDCYSVARDWYRQERGLVLPDYPRRWRWWRSGRADAPPDDLFGQYFADAGFRPIAYREAGPGDALLLRVASPVVSHCAVIVEPGVMLHHPGGSRPRDPARLSRREPVARWTPYIAAALRHPDA